MATDRVWKVNVLPDSSTIECRNLDMVDCDFICASPDHPNIFYEFRPRTDIDMGVLVSSLKEHHIKAIVYCRTLDMCADLYAHFHHELCASSYYPPGAAHVSSNRMFGI